MRRKHRVTFNKASSIRKEIEKLGLRAKKGDIIWAVEIYDDESLWPDLKSILDSQQHSYATGIVFSKDEILDAIWVQVLHDFIRGYPMPDDDFGYKDLSFQPECECTVCGVGRKQIASIRLKGEPKVGQNHFMGVNWLFDVFFVARETIQSMAREEISGFETMPVIDHKTDEELGNIQQLVLTTEHSASICSEGLARDRDATCGHTKYELVMAEMLKFDSRSFENSPDLVRTYEWFGSGHQAYQLVLASSRFVKLYLQQKWKGLYFRPIQLV